MKRVLASLACGIVISLLICDAVWAQATAQINGTVKDQTGAVLPGVQVVATQTETNVGRMTVTDETGSFTLPNLAIGPYKLEATLPGFRSYVQTGIVLQVNTNPVVNVVLQVGQAAEAVEVKANTELVETRTSGIGAVIENQRILELPLNGRQVTDLIVLSGAAVQTTVADARTMQGSVKIAVGGGLQAGLAYALDGAMHNNPWDGGNLPLPFPDALQEFKVDTSGLSAQNGMHSAGSVNALVKSGTNDYHGDLFEFVRNGAFNARNAFALVGDSLKRNQFGGTVGGPIVKNRLFFFAGDQETTLRQAPAANIAFVPTAAMLAGDFTALASAACQSKGQVTLKGGFVGNRINPSAFSPAALKIAQKLPQTSDPCGRIVYSSSSIEDDQQVVGKIDYQKNANNSLFGRFMVTQITIPAAYGGGHSNNLLTTITPGFNNRAVSYTIGDNYLLGSNKVNSFRLAVNRTNVHRNGAQYFGPQDVGINIYAYQPKYTSINVQNGGFVLGGQFQGDNQYWVTAYQASDDLSWVRGAHQISLGVNFAQWRQQATINNGSTSPFTFNGQVSGLSLADFLLGTPSIFLENTPNPLDVHQVYAGVYAQDAWKMRPRLTLNYGLRWEPYLPQYPVNKKFSHFDLNQFLAGVKTTQYNNAPAGFSFPGDPGFPAPAGFNKRWNIFEPRVGLAWDVKGDGLTSVRASYALSTDFVQGQYDINIVATSPFGTEVDVNSPTGGLDNPWLGYPGGNPFPRVINPNSPFSQYGFFVTGDYNIHPPTVETWNLSLQRQVQRDWLLSASYLGTKLTHLWAIAPINPATYFPGGACTINGANYNPCSSTGNTNQRRLMSLLRPQDGQYIGVMDRIDDGSTSGYHGLLLGLQRRVTQGVNVSSNYAWSHCIGEPGSGSNGPSGSNNGNQDAGELFPANRRVDRANCTADRRHILNMTVVADTPRFSNSTARMLGTGWRVSGIYRISTGQFLNISTGVDRALSGVDTSVQRPNQILGNIYGNRTVQHWLNGAAFAQPDLGTNGNVGHNSALGPGTWQFDMAVTRTFQPWENRRFEFRAEAFNLFNGTRLGNPDTSLNSSTFGQILSAADPRILQFALKFLF